MGKEILIKGGYGKCFPIYKGEHVKIMDVEGKQVADFIAINLHDHKEYMSTSHTRTMNGNISVYKGDTLYSNYRNPLFKIVDDTVGVHDTLYPCCDPMRYLLDFNIEDHRSCRENFMEELKQYGIEYWRIPDPVNLFQNAPINSDGSFAEVSEPKSEPGDYVLLEALSDCIVGISACPMDLTSLCGWNITDILVVVSNRNV